MMYITAVSWVLVQAGLLIRNVDDGLPVYIKLQFAGGFLTTFFWVYGAHHVYLYRAENCGGETQSPFYVCFRARQLVYMFLTIGSYSCNLAIYHIK